ncbi:MAG TPA: hypothetical protein VGT03_03745 [Candidatus Acidoferrales bacterium]|nr:hypothetical protein [Candidatus Acidoferrales bacterium]
MRRSILLFLFVVGLILGARPALATTFAVGTCRPSLVSFPTISAAVSSPLTIGGTILVCPGTYGEQVVISQPLTLQGISSADSDQVIIAVPAGGLSTSIGIAAVQVFVTTGPVNISNIIVDGTGNNLAGTGVNLVGIFYDSGSSGVINHVTTRNQIDSGEGFGIEANNTGSTSESVTIENSSVHDFDNSGITAFTNSSSPSLTAIIKANRVNQSDSTITNTVFGIAMNAPGSVTGNIVTGAGNATSSEGISVTDGPVTISGNSVSNWGTGIVDFFGAGATYASNSVSNSGFGIFLVASGAVVQSNTITESPFVGIDFFCEAATVSGNTINDTPTGINDVLTSFSMSNTFFNVGTIRDHGGCTASLSNSSPKRPMPRPVPLSDTR